MKNYRDYLNMGLRTAVWLLFIAPFVLTVVIIVATTKLDFFAITDYQLLPYISFALFIIFSLLIAVTLSILKGLDFNGQLPSAIGGIFTIAIIINILVVIVSSAVTVWWNGYWLAVDLLLFGKWTLYAVCGILGISVAIPLLVKLKDFAEDEMEKIRENFQLNRFEKEWAKASVRDLIEKSHNGNLPSHRHGLALDRIIQQREFAIIEYFNSEQILSPEEIIWASLSKRSEALREAAKKHLENKWGVPKTLDEGMKNPTFFSAASRLGFYDNFSKEKLSEKISLYFLKNPNQIGNLLYLGLTEENLNEILRFIFLDSERMPFEWALSGKVRLSERTFHLPEKARVLRLAEVDIAGYFELKTSEQKKKLTFNPSKVDNVVAAMNEIARATMDDEVIKELVALTERLFKFLGEHMDYTTDGGFDSLQEKISAINLNLAPESRVPQKK